LRISFLDVPVDLLSFEGTVAHAVAAMRDRQSIRHVGLNVANLVKMRSDAGLRRDVTESDIIGIDGMGIVYGLKLFGEADATRVSGCDLMMALLEHCSKEGFRPYILGATREALDQAAIEAQKRWPGLTFAGMRDGYFKPDDEAGVVAEIAASNADCLFVAMPTPRKERFIHKYGSALCVPFMMGVGGSVDVLAGHVSRAPRWMQASGLEWFHRLSQEPRKMFWRYASTNAVFAGLLLRATAARLVGRKPIQRIAQ
jgi:N-acetylglucosaminyldiphosphoundecaprenol N-acetyl-beta-D-mannosaminyltransferase